MNYQIFIWGKDKEEFAHNEEDALWTLGSRYGGLAVNKAVEQGSIVFHKDYVEIFENEVDKIIEDIKLDRLKRGLAV